jgi:hypothetical protein
MTAVPVHPPQVAVWRRPWPGGVIDRQCGCGLFRHLFSRRPAATLRGYLESLMTVVPSLLLMDARDQRPGVSKRLEIHAISYPLSTTYDPLCFFSGQTWNYWMTLKMLYETDAMSPRYHQDTDISG